MASAFEVLAALVVLGVAYLVAWPVPIAPRRWAVGPDPGYRGPFAENHTLAGLQRIALDGRTGPEHLAIGPDGRLYTGVAGGEILRIDPDGGRLEVFAKTGGRVLGLTFDAQGRLLAADALRGLLIILPDGKASPLVDHFEGEPVLLANSVIVASNGIVYFTDSSCRFGAERWGSAFEASKRDILEQSATGRLLAHDPATGDTRLVAHGLSFANGVALTADESYVYVNETGRYRIWRVPVEARGLDLTRGPTGGATIFLDNLPGFPDNLMRGLPGASGEPRVWCGLVKPRNPALDQLADKPFLRKIALRLPDFLQPIPKDYSHIFAFNDRGEIVASLQDPSGAYPETTSALEFGDRLYVASLKADWLGWLKRPG
jgi:sugar lactone lactonase YvrE